MTSLALLGLQHRLLWRQVYVEDYSTTDSFVLFWVIAEIKELLL